MNGIIEKVAGVLLVAYVGTTEWRIRGKVSEKRFEDLKEYIKERFDSLENTIKEDKNV